MKADWNHRVRVGRSRVSIYESGPILGVVERAVDAFKTGDVDANQLAHTFVASRIDDPSPTFELNEETTALLLPQVTGIAMEPDLTAETADELAPQLVELVEARRIAAQQLAEVVALFVQRFQPSIQATLGRLADRLEPTRLQIRDSLARAQAALASSEFITGVRRAAGSEDLAVWLSAVQAHGWDSLEAAEVRAVAMDGMVAARKQKLPEAEAAFEIIDHAAGHELDDATVAELTNAIRELSEQLARQPNQYLMLLLSVLISLTLWLIPPPTLHDGDDGYSGHPDGHQAEGPARSQGSREAATRGHRDDKPRAQK